MKTCKHTNDIQLNGSFELYTELGITPPFVETVVKTPGLSRSGLME